MHFHVHRTFWDLTYSSTFSTRKRKKKVKLGWSERKGEIKLVSQGCFLFSLPWQGHFWWLTAQGENVENIGGTFWNTLERSTNSDGSGTKKGEKGERPLTLLGKRENRPMTRLEKCHLQNPTGRERRQKANRHPTLLALSFWEGWNLSCTKGLQGESCQASKHWPAIWFLFKVSCFPWILQRSLRPLIGRVLCNN